MSREWSDRRQRAAQLLGLAADADRREVRRAFRKLAFRCHPDRFGGDPEMERRFKRLHAAYRLLVEDNDRYPVDTDRFRSASKAPRARKAPRNSQKSDTFSGTTAANPRSSRNFSFWNEIFSWKRSESQGPAAGPPPNRKASPRRAGASTWCSSNPPQPGSAPSPRGADLRFRLHLDPSFAATGGEVSFRFSRPVSAAPGADSRPVILRVDVPPRLQTGDQIRLAGQGNPAANGGAPGDLYITVAVA